MAKASTIATIGAVFLIPGSVLGLIMRSPVWVVSSLGIGFSILLIAFILDRLDQIIDLLEELVDKQNTEESEENSVNK